MMVEIKREPHGINLDRCVGKWYISFMVDWIGFYDLFDFLHSLEM